MRSMSVWLPAVRHNAPLFLVVFLSLGPAAPALGQIGPDIIVSDLPDVLRFGSEGGYSAYAVATTSCNVGDTPAQWCEGVFPCPDITRHPVIAQDMYRLSDGRFEQIGMSWVKHGYWANNLDGCGDCEPPKEFAILLGVNCSDTYSSGFNGAQSRLAPRGQINPVTGEFPYPFEAPPVENVLSRRIRIADSDLDPDVQPGAKYFVATQYVARDDAEAGNDLNNGGYRSVKVRRRQGFYEFRNAAGAVVSESHPLMAWQQHDHEVQLTAIDVPGDGRVVVGSRVYALGDGTWRYEYAIYNQNSHRSVRAFTVPVDPAAGLTDVGFHDIDHHSGDGEDGGVYSDADWDSEQMSNYVSWYTQTFDDNVNANALRWGTTFNFRFTANLPPASAPAALGLFRPGSAPEVMVHVPAPSRDAVARCDNVRRARALCRQGEVHVRVRLLDDSDNGRRLVFGIGSRTVEAVVRGQRARGRICCFGAKERVEWRLPEACRDPLPVSCP